MLVVSVKRTCSRIHNQGLWGLAGVLRFTSCVLLWSCPRNDIVVCSLTFAWPQRSVFLSRQQEISLARFCWSFMHVHIFTYVHACCSGAHYPCAYRIYVHSWGWVVVTRRVRLPSVTTAFFCSRKRAGGFLLRCWRRWLPGITRCIDFYTLKLCWSHT